jgi:hypothetical protein
VPGNLYPARDRKAATSARGEKVGTTTNSVCMGMSLAERTRNS